MTTRLRLPLAGRVPLARRDFLEMALAASSVAAAGGCARPPRAILPYSTRITDIVPGNPLHYATAFVHDGYASGVVVTTREGRPIKVEGNPDHPVNRGAAGPFEQASLMQLYDPGRARVPKLRGEPSAAREFFRWMADRATELDARRGAGLRFLFEPTGSPLLEGLRDRLLARFPEARFHYFAPTAPDNARAGAALAFGRPLDMLYDVGGPAVIVALDADPLGQMPGSLKHARDFANRRAPEPGAPPMNRLYVAEAAPSLTGGMADHRFAMRSDDVRVFAAELLREITSRIAVGGGRRGREPGAEGAAATFRSALASLPPGPFAARARAVAADLVSRPPGQTLVMAGPRQPPVVHALAHAANALLGNVGAAVRPVEPLTIDAAPRAGNLADLVRDLNAGQVELLVVQSFDPVYSAPRDLDVSAAIRKARASVSTSLYEDSTSPLATWFVPAAHDAESWGDARAADGTVTLQQPLIEPLFGGLCLSEILVSLLGEGGKRPRDILSDFWRDRAKGRSADFDAYFEQALARGTVDGEAARPAVARIDWDGVAAAVRGDAARPRAPDSDLELDWLVDAKVHDGRYAENGWLQELPEPFTRLTWGNAVRMNGATAARVKKGLDSGAVVTLRSAGRAVRGPVLIDPMMADGAVAVSLGYGRAQIDSSSQEIGFDAYSLRTSDAPWFCGGLAIEPTGHEERLAIVEHTGSTENRPIAPMTTLAELGGRTGELAEAREESESLPSLYKRYPYSGYQWAMAIDMSRCIGCAACVVACNAENNVPVVGRGQVLKGREMHWLRIDRYYHEARRKDGRTAIEPIMEPLMCVHCENAPCEYPCPVNATVHSEEGINEMVYNRCVGTRFCQNNCPYKVRRFNYLEYQNFEDPVTPMRNNPEVSVRSRGVMEKCTYCVQRVERGRIDAEVENRPIRDGDVMTACQETCPTGAIVFGSIHDPGTAVYRLRESARAYSLLGSLGTRPRTRHLARVKNPNPDIESA